MLVFLPHQRCKFRRRLVARGFGIDGLHEAVSLPAADPPTGLRGRRTLLQAGSFSKLIREHAYQPPVICSCIGNPDPEVQRDTTLVALYPALQL